MGEFGSARVQMPVDLKLAEVTFYMEAEIGNNNSQVGHSQHSYGLILVPEDLQFLDICEGWKGGWKNFLHTHYSAYANHTIFRFV